MQFMHQIVSFFFKPSSFLWNMKCKCSQFNFIQDILQSKIRKVEISLEISVDETENIGIVNL